MSHQYIAQQLQIRATKTWFETALSEQLDLVPVEGPILADLSSGVQDNLSGKEHAVQVKVKSLPEQTFEVVHSLAKWKRQLVSKHQFPVGKGIVVNMKALRPDESELSPLHSVYVDQWDWEKVICADTERDVAKLKQTVTLIFNALKATERKLEQEFGIPVKLPEQIQFLHAEQLRADYPELTPKQREDAVCKKFGAVFLMGIGTKLGDGSIHDERAPDYDDWSSLGEDGTHGLNGDILLWHPVLERAFEISSMGIRVSPSVLTQQLALTQQQARAQLPWHQQLFRC